MATINITIKCKLAWWVPVYIWLVGNFCNTFGLEPDIEKVTDFAVKYGLKVTHG